ncbi:MAG: trimethylamine methyltransferase family protein [Armatimonadota bacterium]
MHRVLSQPQIEDLHAASLRVLEETGVRVESDQLLEILDGFGGHVDAAAQRVRFAASRVEQFIQESERYDWSQHQPRFYCGAGIYGCLYLNPETDQLEPFTENTFRDYIRIGNALEEVHSVSTLGIPFAVDGLPPAYAALAEKLYGWRYGAYPSGTVQLTGLCPYIEEMYARRAAETGRPLADVFSAVGYLVSPLRLARAECEQLLYFRSHNLRMDIGHLLSLGASAPITLAGAVVLALAESLFLGMLQRALWGDRSFRVGGSVMVMDMRTTISMYGRPEQIVMSAMIGQVARWYGVAGGGCAGLTDAREPSVQAGAQKAIGAVAGITSCGAGSIDAGLLSTDAILSSEQLIYDNELAAAVRQLMRPVEVSEEALAVAEIAEVGPGGSFIGTDLTTRRFRTEVWNPGLWAGGSTQMWQTAGAVSDRTRAKQRIRQILSEPRPEPSLSEECERDLRAIIRRAVDAGAAG